MDALKLAGVKNLPAFTHGEKWDYDRKIRRPILRVKGKRIEKVDGAFALAVNMLETMCREWRRPSGPTGGRGAALTVLDVLQVEDRPSTMKLNGRRWIGGRDASRPGQSENPFG
jgi:hypothetical protein